MDQPDKVPWSRSSSARSPMSMLVWRCGDHPTWGAKKLLKVVATRQPTGTLPARSTVRPISGSRGTHHSAAGERPSGRPAAVGDAPGDPMLGQQPGEFGRASPHSPVTLARKHPEQTLLSLPLVDIVEPAQGLRHAHEPIGRSEARTDRVATTRSTAPGCPQVTHVPGRSHRACAWPARTRCRGAGRARREARCRCSCSGGGTAVGAPRGGRRCSR